MIFQYLKNRYQARRPIALLYLGLIDSFWWCIKKFSTRKATVTTFNPEKSPAIQKILLVNGAHLGDLVISTAVIRCIKESNPHIQIGFITGSWGSDLLKTHPGVDYFYPVNHWRLNRSATSKLSKVLLYWKQWRAAYHAIRKEQYDVAILLNSFFPNFASLLWFSNCKLTIGYVSSGGGPLLDVCLSKPDQPEQANQLQLLSAINIEGPSSGWVDIDQGQLSKTIQDTLPQQYILLHPGTGNPHKEWPIERWIKLGKMLSDEGHDIVLTGHGDTESALCKRIASEVNGIDLSNQINLHDWCFAIQKSDLIIGVDSAAGHIAAALNKPFIGIYSGIGEVTRWTPSGDKTFILTHAMPCSPCHTRPCKERPCLLKIEPKNILSATHRMLTQ